jgi:hypothetical protein
MAQAKPVVKFRAGAVACALWENSISVEGQTRHILKATVERRYRDPDGTWKSTSSFSRNEVPLVLYVLSKAYAVMVDRDNEGQKEDAPQEEAVE